MLMSGQYPSRLDGQGHGMAAPIEDIARQLWALSTGSSSLLSCHSNNLKNLGPQMLNLNKEGSGPFLYLSMNYHKLIKRITIMY